jgi:hypothetical protein
MMCGFHKSPIEPHRSGPLYPPPNGSWRVLDSGRGLSRIFDVRTREDAWTQQQDALIPVRLLPLHK